MSEDFFSNDFSSPPKQTATLANRARKPPPPRGPVGASNGSGASAPPPPPRARPASGINRAAKPASTATPATATATATATTTSTRTAAAAARARPTRPTAANSTTPSTTNTPAASAPAKPTNSRVTAARKAPVMARPVGQYYASESAAQASKPSTNPYSSNSYFGASAASTTTNAAGSNDAGVQDSWDWGSPAPAATTSAPNTWQPSASVPAPAPAVGTSDDDWFTDDNNNASLSSVHTNNTNNSLPAPAYTSSGFYGSSSNQAAAAAPTQASAQQPAFLAGSMDDTSSTTANNHMNNSMRSAPGNTMMMQPQQNIFMPQASSSNSMDATSQGGNVSYEDEPPLLEELDINLEHIYIKTKAVVFSPFGRWAFKALGTNNTMEASDIVQDSDLAGPIAFCMILGAEMVLIGKLQFSYIYSFGVFGCLAMTLIVNLMTPLAESISVWTVSSILGYALIPVNVLAATQLLMNIANLETIGRILGLLTVAWSTVASTRLFEYGCGLREQRYLIAYPIALLYSAFVLITIF